MKEGEWRRRGRMRGMRGREVRRKEGDERKEEEGGERSGQWW